MDNDNVLSLAEAIVALPTSVVIAENPKQATRSIAFTCLDRSHNKRDITVCSKAYLPTRRARAPSSSSARISPWRHLPHPRGVFITNKAIPTSTE